MKLITAIIKPFKLDDVKDALRGAGIDEFNDRHACKCACRPASVRR